METDYSGSDENIDRERISSHKLTVKVKNQKLEGDVEKMKQMKRNRKLGQKKEKNAQDAELEKMNMQVKLGYIKGKVFRTYGTEAEIENKKNGFN